jgi:pimeloyl-ACP methyl ester carboxylesterase
MLHGRKIGACAFVVSAAITLLAQAPAPKMDIPRQGHFASVNGIKLYYEEYGTGEPLLLIHGFQGAGAMWGPVIPELSKHYHLIVVDMRGHGHSTNPTNQFTHKQSALDMYALLDSLGIKQFSAMGISSGGMTLLHMATQQPSRVKSMVLIGATIYFPEQARVIMRHDAPEQLTAEEIARARQFHVYGEEQIRALRTEFHNFKDSYDDMNFTPPLLGTITAQTLIVHGDRDVFFAAGIPTSMYCAIPNSYLWIIPNGSHVPIIEHVPEFTKLSLEFLAGEWAKRTGDGRARASSYGNCMLPQ